ncbi:hypothetical protein Daura_25490 [Dactylosporangium aurantiacum]|uniref:Uncharacterized protein n=1 Tax=Dactylosporangium aurantiacum TaxID=35754 RepID=A0A9Q9MND5_9ACTN|nr:hypothetical protein [Dactylosporangium aurantiacum]MDG6107976.1 hypothetical protein [Dactylosporangium aurantiacum]UWZ59216.1 hypothetical protein Daura_25490 [Dactylosporangium aurantiacum]
MPAQQVEAQVPQVVLERGAVHRDVHVAAREGGGAAPVPGGPRLRRGAHDVVGQ